ncbi:type II toxin-antitoxin system RelE/ParE family toxin [Chryseobacterium oryctis]|uniref:Type II toxin-antitoxin system RelE/ParE family toxin n=1 Tax=Chryseobacterium oryctis TaxID=2952618 RepID=A0ABT3HSB3_9FLAO|nr:type II toxin-antitoxin system RelE/ParE family toxin [Chryseobacterium oryctis]MCW3162629.1 type II toxin-antitoxin system RelE/ParE family toxin [Chryseobacterium oryctis]
MEYNLIVKPKAQQDIRKSIEWYREQSGSLSEKFLEKIDESLEKISKNPEHYQKRYNEIRIAFTKKFPYGIYYTVEEKTIYIHAILHTKQNPQTAEKRIK